MFEFDVWFHPEFGFPVTTVNMYVHPSFFTGEEKEPETSRAKKRRTHDILPVPSGYAYLSVVHATQLRVGVSITLVVR